MRNFIFYQGASELDGAPIVAIATLRSSNGKTGAMVQTWILRADRDPVNAAREGLDASICGDCVHRGEYFGDGKRIRKPGTRTCYVQLQNAPHGIFKAFAKGRYEVLTPCEGGARVAGLKVRLGSYGDPAAVPFHVWRGLLEHAAGNTGYTHQWRSYPELAAWCMASCDSEVEALQAQMLGYRTFRVANARDWSRLANEALCGASKEAGKKVTCQACMACGGTSAKARCSIVIPAHGASKLRVVG